MRFWCFLILLGACSAPHYPSSAEGDCTPMEEVGVPELMRVTADIWTGGQPQGLVGLKALKELGVRTLINVDGAHPDAEGAKSLGMRYVHIPMDYAEVEVVSLLSIFRVVSELEGPFYFHCHHGKHRGPVAAALAWRILDGVSADRALQVLHLAGTSSSYPGLWKAVNEWTPLPSTVALPPLYSKAEVSDFKANMAAIDRTWDRLKLLQQADWSAVLDHPDLDVATEVAIFTQNFESALGMAKDSQEYQAERRLLDYLDDVVTQSKELRQYLLEGNLQAADSTLTSIKQSCKECHRVYRNE